MNSIPNDDETVLKTSQEAPIWIAANLVLLAVLVLMSFIFRPTADHLPGPDWLIGPLAGWIVGNVLGWLAPTGARIPSWAVPAIGLVLIVLFTVTPADWRSVLQPAAGFIIGAGCSFLTKRAVVAKRAAAR